MIRKSNLNGTLAALRIFARRERVSCRTSTAYANAVSGVLSLRETVECGARVTKSSPAVENRLSVIRDALQIQEAASKLVGHSVHG